MAPKNFCIVVRLFYFLEDYLGLKYRYDTINRRNVALFRYVDLLPR